MKDKIYWFITVFRNFDPKYGTVDSRTWGFYSNKEDALKVLDENRTDIWETIYDYAVLEAYNEGISAYNFKAGRQFFKYNQELDSYKPIEEPEEVRHYASFAIG